MVFKLKRVRFGKRGRRYTTYTTRFGRKSPYNSKSWKYNGRSIYL